MIQFEKHTAGLVIDYELCRSAGKQTPSWLGPVAGRGAIVAARFEGGNDIGGEVVRDWSQPSSED